MAQTQVSQILDPQLKYIADLYNRKATGVSGAIQGATDSYAGLLGQLAGNVPGYYEGAQRTVSGAAQGINAQLANMGKASAQAEAQAAAQAGLPSGGQSPDIDLAKAGKGAGGAAGAIGDAAVNALAQAQKAAMTYAEKLPGFAQLEGHQQIASALSMLSREMAEQMAATTAQAPELFFTIYEHLLDRAQRDKEFQFQLRQYNEERSAQRAGIVAPNAPTNAGRKAYYEKSAAERSEQTGDLWEATTSGIRPHDADPSRPGIQRQRTDRGKASDYLNEGRVVSAQATATRAQASAANAQTAATKAATSAQQAAAKEKNRHAEAMARIKVAESNAKTSKQRAAAQGRRDKETARHHRATEAISRSKKTKKKASTFDPSSGDYG